MALRVNRLTNANIYANGNNYIGRAEEITVPDIKTTTADHKALGMVGKLELPSGIDKMEAKIKWNAYYEDVEATFSNPFESVKVQVRASLEKYEGEVRVDEVPVVVHLIGTPKQIPGGSFKQNDNVELETTLNVTYIKKVVNGIETLEYDVINNIFKVDGKDLLKKYRQNLGL